MAGGHLQLPSAARDIPVRADGPTSVGFSFLDSSRKLSAAIGKRSKNRLGAWSKVSTTIYREPSRSLVIKFTIAVAAFHW